jgi:NAD(P)-dependent dehydrogenase (short-subunit alcohol dehydrogenase family)
MEQRVAVITGAASGIGWALTQACVQRNMAIVMADVAEESLHQKAQQIGGPVLPVVCDVKHFEQVEQLAEQAFQQFKHVDLVINNAGICAPFAPLWELTPQQIQDVMDVNVYGIIHGVQAFLPRLFQQAHRSKIVNMASFYGLCSGSLIAPYAMSKHAILALSESLFFDLRRLNKPVDVSVVCPSFVNTSLLNSSSPNPALHQIVETWMERGRPAADVAEHILDELEKEVFYILPDKEVKAYCEERTQAIVEQTAPHRHSLEKIMTALYERASRS